MRRVKIFRHTIDKYCDYCGCENDNHLTAETVEWEEVSDEAYWEIQSDIQYANLHLSKNREEYRYLMVSPVTDNERVEIKTLASEWREQIRKEREKRLAAEKAKEEAKKAKEAKKALDTLQKKRAQLEKLKKELGEE